ncbi:MAG: ATP-binding protein [Spirochaetales bacterium]|nr:ATP-binding protein [Spirochaetales bacterium]
MNETMQSAGCVVIEGPKWCGKSTEGMRIAKTTIELAKPNIFRQYKLFSDSGDPNLLKGEKPIMFDEWQKIPDLWDYIRSDIDHSGNRGEYILTGSTKPKEDENRHSGTGRIKKIIMRPMSLWESKESTGEVSLEDLFNNIETITGKNSHTFDDVAFFLCRGGWPQAVLEKNRKRAVKAPVDYVASLVEEELSEVDEKRRNPARARAILRAYSRNISTPARLSTIQADIEANDAVLDPRTLDSYLNAFEKLYVIEEIEAWSPKLRSKTTIRTTNSRQTVDPSIAAAAIHATPNDLINDLNTFGLLFESLCIRDLRIYAQRLEGTVFNYRDSNGLEADAIIHLNNGKWAAIEIKLGSNDSIDLAAKNLIKLRAKVDTQRMGEPSFLMIITATQYAYKREDGVLVVPIACLKN